MPELEKKLKNQISKIAEINAQILIIEEQISEVKISIDNPTKEEDENLSEEIEELSVISMRSTNLSVKPQREEKIVSFAQETFCQDIMHRSNYTETFSEIPIEYKELQSALIDTPRFVESKFPNFNLQSEDLYGEEPKKKAEEQEDIIYESSNELMGCCRSRFFCF